MSGPPVDLSEFLAGFLAEADDHLGAATRNLLAVEANLQRGQPSPRPVRELYRSMHTMKGLSAMVGVEPIVEIAHALEVILREADRAGGRLGELAIDHLTYGIAAIEQRVRALERHEPVAAAPVALLRALSKGARPGGAAQSATGSTPAAGSGAFDRDPDLAGRLSASERQQLESGVGDGRRAVRVDFVPTVERAAAGHNITAVRQRLDALGEIVKVLPLSRPVGPEAPSGLAFAILLLTAAADDAIAAAVATEPARVATLSLAAPGATPATPAPTETDAAAADSDDPPLFEPPLFEPPLFEPPLFEPDDRSVEVTLGARGIVRVEVERLDDAMEKLSAMVVTRFRIERELSALRERGADVRALAAIIQDSARQLKALRGAIMRARMIATAELLERVPLLVRRLARDTGHDVKLELDSGRGELDKAVAERVFPAIVHLLRNAVDHGIEPPDERRRAGKPAEGALRVACFERGSNQLEISIEDDGRGIDRQALAGRAGRPVPQTDQALLALLTLPGLSTRAEASQTSGRGMGMDIVRRVVVDELGGELHVRTTPGRGTAFLLRLPLTITIVDALLFRSGAQFFAVPVAAVDELVHVEEETLTRAPAGPNRAELRMLTRRGMPVPLVNLASVFSLTAPRPTGAYTARPKAIVVRRNGQPVAFEVDHLLGQQEVVVRPLEDPLAQAPGIVGATDLGDGQPTLVLDLVSLSGRLSRRKTDVRA